MRVILALGVLALGCGGSTSGGGGGASGGTTSGGSGGTAATGGSGGTAVIGGSGGVGDGGMGGVSASGGTGAIGPGQPPPPDPNAPPASGPKPTTLAIRKLFLGETDTQGNLDPVAWKAFGLNVDGLVSTSSSTNHCKLQLGGGKYMQADGNDGIDNSFGANVMKVVASLSASPTQDLNDSIAAGDSTLLVQLGNLGPEPSQAGVKAALLGGAKLGKVPSWSGSDAWPVTFESVTNGNVAQPKVAYPASYVSAGTWVGAPPASAPLDLALGIQGFVMAMRIHHPRVVAKLGGSGPGLQASGVISGVIDTEEYVAELKKIAGSFDVTLCQGATFDSIAQQIRASSDLMKDGSNGDPSKTCDGISIGLAFEASAALLGPVASPAPAQPDPCK